MKQRQGWIIGAAIGCLLVAGMGRVEAKELPIKGKSSGTFLSTRIDRNDDGVPANWSTGVTTGTLGNRIFQAVSELVPTGPTAVCPGACSSSMRKTGREVGPSPKPSPMVTSPMDGYSPFSYPWTQAYYMTDEKNPDFFPDSRALPLLFPTACTAPELRGSLF